MSATQAEVQPPRRNDDNHTTSSNNNKVVRRGKQTRAWEDEDDNVAEATTPAFLRESHTVPSWAQTSGGAAKAGEPSATAEDVTSLLVQDAARKRFRSDELDALLTRTEPLLTAKKSDPYATTPAVLSVLPLPRDTARTLHWHRNGQLALVGGNHHIYAFHASGSFVEQLFKIDVREHVAHTALSASGEQLIVAGQRSYVPRLLSLATEQMTPLRFLDTRDTAVYRNEHREQHSSRGKSRHNIKAQRFLSALATPPCATGASFASEMNGDLVAVAHGCNVRLGSLLSGSVAGHIVVSDPVQAVRFGGAAELLVASGPRLLIYDLRHTSRFVRAIEDEGALRITAFDVCGRSLAVGSSSGVVNLYDRHVTNTNNTNEGNDETSSKRQGRQAGAALRPVKVLKNLTTACTAVCFGANSAGAEVMAFCTRGQKAAFRLAPLPDCRVVPGFPAVAMRHGFVEALAIAPTVPVLSVGERQKVTNYAL